MRIELWIASPPTCSVRTPRDSLTAIEGLPFLAMHERSNACRGREREQRARGNRRLIAAPRVVGDAGEPRAEQRADAAAGIEAADDAGHRARPIKVHHDGGQ